MSIPPPPGAIPPPPGAPTADAELAARLARLQQRRQPAAAAAGASPSARPAARRRHPAAGARAGALALTVVTTGGLGALMATLDAAQGTSQALASLPAPLPTSSSASGSTSSQPQSTAASSTPQAFDGAFVNTRYGPVQVQAQITGGTITDVAVIAYPDGDGRSRGINARALPELRTEVLAAQQANVDTVSGATYTSEAYRESLQAAIDQARSEGVSIA